MISNSDNTGATLDPRIADHIAAHEIPFLMEVVEGTEAERKGGHIARRRGRRTARSCVRRPRRQRRTRNPSATTATGATTTRTTCGSTCGRSTTRSSRSGGVLELPLIVNRKTVDPRDSSSTPVLQLESAMGAAIGSFPGASLLCVPRTRFVPVKTTDDLLVLRSDVYRLSDEMLVEPRGASCPSSSSTAASTSCSTSSSAGSRTGRRHCARPSDSSSTATSRSAPVSW